MILKIKIIIKGSKIICLIIQVNNNNTDKIKVIYKINMKNKTNMDNLMVKIKGYIVNFRMITRFRINFWGVNKFLIRISILFNLWTNINCKINNKIKIKM